MMHSVVVGLGKTGASCVRHLAKRGVRVSATDSRGSPPGLLDLGAAAEGLDLRLGGFDLSLLDDASQLVVSPGVSLEEPIAATARIRGIEILGDIELFARAVRAPVIGITGTNGKSTVTTLLARMAATAGLRVLAGGNLGPPALDLLDQSPPDLYVLELSSFQLDTTKSLRLEGAVVLNVSADHLDRYASVAHYADSKARIFSEAATVVLNADDAWVARMGHAYRESRKVVTFSVLRNDADFALLTAGKDAWLTRRGERLMDAACLKIQGLHNAANALAALALGEAAGLPTAAMCAALESFPGLPHRSAWVADIAGVRYIDDSKGTNVGATVAAAAGLPGPLVLIAGGEAKGQDFTPLGEALRGKLRKAVLIGRDARAVAAALGKVCAIEIVDSMAAAVQAAQASAHAGDTVLLSPACASLDMFRDYAHRGDAFAAAVRELPGARP
jgi:UDP-N-acetylmuramoylalanine--D-glutamate ligase